MLSVNINQILHVWNISYWKNSNIKTYSYEISGMSKPVKFPFYQQKLELCLTELDLLHNTGVIEEVDLIQTYYHIFSTR